MLWELATIIGPAVGGVLVGSFDVGVVYTVNAVSFTAVIIALLLMNYAAGLYGYLF